jgi:hypothetical protein
MRHGFGEYSTSSAEKHLSPSQRWRLRTSPTLRSKEGLLHPSDFTRWRDTTHTPHPLSRHTRGPCPSRGRGHLSPRGEGTQHMYPTKHHKINPISPSTSISSLGILHTELTRGSPAISRGLGTRFPPPKGLRDTIYPMRPED